MSSRPNVPPKIDQLTKKELTVKRIVLEFQQGKNLTPPTCLVIFVHVYTLLFKQINANVFIKM